jgi:structure-specific recognition protein 1
MRFHVLNNELEAYNEKKEKEHEAKKGEESKDAESDEDEEMTAAKLFN